MTMAGQRQRAADKSIVSSVSTFKCQGLRLELD